MLVKKLVERIILINDKLTVENGLAVRSVESSVYHVGYFF